MSTRKTSRPTRRDLDPVRVYADGRICYWTGGVPGQGKRRIQRCGTRENAEAEATRLRAKLALMHGAQPEVFTTVDAAFQAMLISMRKNNRPAGTISQYKSNWNVWVPELVGTSRCIDVEIRHWSAIFDYAVQNAASKSTVKSIARTVSAFTTWAVDHGYFVDAEPFGEPRRRRSIVKRAYNTAPSAGSDDVVTLNRCPSVADIQKFAAAFEEQYPGYGERLVLLALGTGLRINELLALRHDSIDLDTGVVAVISQLDRSNPWPATVPPKGEKTRVAFMWTATADIARSLIADSLERPAEDPHHGWLFPRYRSVTAWADRAGHLAGAAVANCDWQWTFHWLRHSHASYSLAPVQAGGFGLDLKSVSEWLGSSPRGEPRRARCSLFSMTRIQRTRCRPRCAAP